MVDEEDSVSFGWIHYFGATIYGPKWRTLEARIRSKTTDEFGDTATFTIMWWRKVEELW